MGLSPEVAKTLSMSRFYTHDGTWRTSEPSWRVVLHQAENVRGAPSVSMQYALNDPALRNYQVPGRRLVVPEAPPQRVLGDPESAAAAAAAYVRTNFKDQKRTTGFATVTLCHTSFAANEPERWGRLGIGTRERLVQTDRFGDIRIPAVRPVTAMTTTGSLKPSTYPRQGVFPKADVAPRPANPESTGFTRRPLLHTATDLTGGFYYTEPERPATSDADRAAEDVQVVGNKLPTGFTINNEDRAAEDANERFPDDQWARTSVGSAGTESNWYEGVGNRVTKYGEMVPRKLAPHEVGHVNTLRVEESGFTRNKLHQRDHVRENSYVPEVTVERKLQASQLALRMMANPIEYTDPHAHKARK